MSRPAWPSPRTRRALRHGFWRHRRTIRALLVGLAVLSAVQAVSAHDSHAVRAATLARTGSSAGADPTSARSEGGLVTTVVRVADPSASDLVRPGSIVDILATPAEPSVALAAAVATGTATATYPPDGALADVVASGIRVVRVPSQDQSGIGATPGAVLVVAVTATTARVLAAAASARLSVVVRSDATPP